MLGRGRNKRPLSAQYDEKASPVMRLAFYMAGGGGARRIACTPGLQWQWHYPIASQLFSLVEQLVGALDQSICTLMTVKFPHTE